MPQRRVILFAHDGFGLGHLRRIANIAAAIQGPCAALVVSGLRMASWIVAPTCELLQLPGWNSLRSHRSAYWNRAPWLDIDLDGAIQLRADLLKATFDVFKPEAILVDYLPFGQRGELCEALNQSTAKKYLIHRGIIDSSDRPLLGQDAVRSWSRTYDRILIAAERQIVDVATEYGFDPETALKVEYVGYIATKTRDRADVRTARGLGGRQRWVVCSGGGGVGAEEFLRHCVKVAAVMPEVEFDVVFGPQAKEEIEVLASAPDNCRVRREAADLADLHASADVVVTSGGYNSTLEAARGGARLIVHPCHTGTDDEQMSQATRLQAFYPVHILNGATKLHDALTRALDHCREERPVFPFETAGAERIRDILCSDLDSGL